MLKEKLLLLPNKPGCYLMKDKNGVIIYVGKAKNLKNRVKVSLKNLSNSVDQNDETVFYIKYEDLINEINYIDV